MTAHQETYFLRPEAYPVSYWTWLTAEQQRAMLKLTDTLVQALRVTPGENIEIREPAWLFRQTRSQLTFIDGLRGTGKTTLMTTLVSSIADPDELRFKPEDDVSQYALPSEFERTKSNLKILKNRVICVQPIEMEGLPKSTLLMAAILARILRSVQASDGPETRSFQGDLSRDVQRLEQYLRRAALAQNSNLTDRRGNLDREQYGEAVMADEFAQLELMRDLDRILRHVSDRFRSRDLSTSCETQRRAYRERLFLVTIDDLDLNPSRCVEVLRLLRAFSPSRSLFFLCLGQIKLVDDILRMSIAADFQEITACCEAFTTLDKKSFEYRLTEVAVANLRKMIPPQNRIELESELTVSNIKDFRPLGIPNSATLADLMKCIPILDESGAQDEKFPTLYSLVFGSLNQADPQGIEHPQQMTWTSYGGVRAFQVALRRLSDVWMEWNELVAQVPHTGPYDSDHSRLIFECLRGQFRRAVEANPRLSVEASDKMLIEDASKWCSVIPFEDLPARRLYLSDPPSGNEDSQLLNDFVPVLLVKMECPGTALPILAVKRTGGGKWLPNEPNELIDDPSTRGAVVVWHDFLAAHRLAFRGWSTPQILSTVLPVELIWASQSTQKSISFPWPLPCTHSFSATSQFLAVWSEVALQYLSAGNEAARVSGLNTIEIVPRFGDLTRGYCVAFSSSRPEIIDGKITAGHLTDLAILWIMLRLESLHDQSDIGAADRLNHDTIKRGGMRLNARARKFFERYGVGEVGDRLNACSKLLYECFRLRRFSVNGTDPNLSEGCDRFLVDLVSMCLPEYASDVTSEILQRLFSIADENTGLEFSSWRHLRWKFLVDGRGYVDAARREFVETYEFRYQASIDNWLRGGRSRKSAGE
jgi:hypothetical protein